MRGPLASLMVLGMLASGCAGEDAGVEVIESTPVVEATATPESVETVEPSPTETEPSPTPDRVPTVEAAPTLESAASADAPSYLIAGPDGVFRVVDGTRTPVSDRNDVLIAFDDGAGGVVTYAGDDETEIVEHQRAGTDEPVVLATDATPVFTSLVEGRPTLALSGVRTGACDDADAFDFVLVDLATGDRRVYRSCIPLESGESPPQSMGGELAVSVSYDGWPDEAPISYGIVFRDLAGDEVEMAANPWSQRCQWCTLQPRLSPDGRLLAVRELTPDPVDLGADNWDDFAALPLDEQWRRWDQPRTSTVLHFRVIDLETGQVLFEEDQVVDSGSPWAGTLVDFDGRFLLWRDEYVTGEIHITDTVTGEEITVEPDGGTTETDTYEIRFLLPGDPAS